MVNPTKPIGSIGVDIEKINKIFINELIYDFFINPTIDLE